MPTQVNTDAPFVTGPASSTLNDSAVFADASGKVIKDGAVSAGNVVGPASAVLNDIALFADTTGKLLKDNAGVVAKAADILVTNGHLYFNSQLVSDVMLKGVGTALQIRTGTDSAYADLNCANVAIIGGGKYYADVAGTPTPGIDASVAGTSGLGVKVMTFSDGLLTGFA